jgi:hypothetical protein
VIFSHIAENKIHVKEFLQRYVRENLDKPLLINLEELNNSLKSFCDTQIDIQNVKEPSNSTDNKGDHVKIKSAYFAHLKDVANKYNNLKRSNDTKSHNSPNKKNKKTGVNDKPKCNICGNKYHETDKCFFNPKASAETIAKRDEFLKRKAKKEQNANANTTSVNTTTVGLVADSMLSGMTSGT